MVPGTGVYPVSLPAPAGTPVVQVVEFDGSKRNPFS